MCGTGLCDDSQPHALRQRNGVRCVRWSERAYRVDKRILELLKSKADFDFPNQTPTQTASLIPTPRSYTEVRTSL